jgi:prepilin-type N-terminal cleavage/methylation domain-containing protein
MPQSFEKLTSRTFSGWRNRGMTLVELTVALAVLTVAAGSMIQVLNAVNTGQATLWNKQQALHTAEDVAENVLGCEDDWQALCNGYDARPDVDVVVENGDGDPASGWSKITVRVRPVSVSAAADEEVVLVFGKVPD